MRHSYLECYLEWPLEHEDLLEPTIPAKLYDRLDLLATFLKHPRHRLRG